MEIIEKKNVIIDELNKAEEENKKIYIYGAGINAREIYEKVCHKYNISIQGFVLDDEYYSAVDNKTIMDKPVYSMKWIRDNEDEKILLLGFLWYEKNEQLISNITLQGAYIAADVACFFDKTENGEYLDYEFVSKNMDSFESTYNDLCDEKSKAVMQAYINQRISGKFKYLEPYVNRVQYFDEEIVDIRDIGCFVDCGAYIGDTYRSFLNQLSTYDVRFEGSAILWEPGSDNLKVLRNEVSTDKRVMVIPKGAGKEKKIICFDGNGQGGHVSETGTAEIEIDTIDNVVDRKVDMIKMDIEGAEADALLGAIGTIRRDKPVLAICVYHKRDDLIRIPQIIRQICSDYRFYLRAYSRHSTEIVLYAKI